MKIKECKMWKDLKGVFREELDLAKENKVKGIFWLNVATAIAQPLLLGLLVITICIQLGFGLFGASYSDVFNVLTDSYNYEYIGELLGGVAGTIFVFVLIIFAFSLFAGIFMPTANLNAFKAIIVEKRKVTLGEYFGGLFKGSGRYLGYNILHVFLPIVCIGFVVGLLGCIPGLNFTFDNLWIGISMVFFYRCCLKLFRVNDKEIMNNEWRRWMFFSVLAVILGATINETFAVVLISFLVEFDASYMAFKYEPEVYKNFNLNVHEMYAKVKEDKKEELKSEESKEEVKEEEPKVEEVKEEEPKAEGKKEE